MCVRAIESESKRDDTVDGGLNHTMCVIRVEPFISYVHNEWSVC